MKKYAWLTVALLTLWITPLPANDAAMNDGASGPEPLGWRSGEESIIQMKSEHLDIHFGTRKTTVTVRFTFLSHKKGGPAKQKLGFPNSSRSEMDGDISGPIDHLVTRVDGKVVTSELVEGRYLEITKPDGSIFYEKTDDPADPNGSSEGVRKHAWYVIEVDFPEGKEVVVERQYDCPSGGNTNMEAFFIYETRTGGAWKGKIEQLTAEVTFDDSVRTDLVAFTPKNGWVWSEDKSKATLIWKDFEPKTDQDRDYFEISTLDLKRVEEITKENPNDFPPVEDWITGWKQREAER